MRNTSWVLDASPVSVSPPSLKANAFHGNGNVRLYPIVFGNGTVTTATITLRALPAEADNLQADMLHPGQSSSWQAVPLQSAGSMMATATVPLQSGCVLVRVRVKSS